MCRIEIKKDVSDFAESARKHALGMMTAFGVYEYDGASNQLRLVSNVKDVRRELSKKYHFVPAWACFAIGVECLLKAVLCRHECMQVRRGKVSQRHGELRPAGSNHSQAKHILGLVASIVAVAKSNAWLEGMLHKKNITKLYDIDTHALRNNIEALACLVKKDLMTEAERWSLHNALVVLTNVRRNVDLHTFYGLTVGGPFRVKDGGSVISDEIEDLYLPAVNLLLDIYNREAV